MTDRPERLRLACVGGSVTFGLGLENRREECYPAVLQKLLGDRVNVRNFGYSGAAVGRQSNEPYWDTPSFTAVNRFEPEVVVIALGTNDAQHANSHGLETFAEDFLAFVNHFRRLPHVAAVPVVLPPPVFSPHRHFDIESLDKIVRPTIQQVAESVSATVIDGYTPFRDAARLFPDNLHPNAAAAAQLASLVADALQETGVLD
ncbi:MAG: GDSL-type esterase/lipase family protein [Planctomycetota bacterium]